MTLHGLRRDYRYGELNRESLNADPIEQFRLWFDQLRSDSLPDWFEVNAMVLATADPDGRVCSRVVLLKTFSSDGFTFFTNYRSLKGRQLEANPRAALNFFWPMFERQVRIEGTVSKVSADISDEYFQARPVSSRLGAIASPQSEVIGDEEPLSEVVAKLANQYPEDAIPRPAHWGGYRLTPLLVEFWQGKPSRLHDRFQYLKRDQGWEIHRLAP